MDQIAGSPYVELTFDRIGTLVGGSVEEIRDALDAVGGTDLVVLSHGWKFENEAARDLYNAIWPNVASRLSRDRGKVVVAGVRWPSKRYTTGIDTGAFRTMAQSVTQGVEDGEGERDLTEAELEAALADALDEMDDEAGALAEAARAYLDRQDGAAAEVLLAAALGTASPAGEDSELAEAADALGALGNDIGGTLADFADPTELTPEGAQTMGIGGNARSVLGGPRAGVVRVLEQLSYYEMKARAATVGVGLGNALSRVAPAVPARLHLVGHSFGGRVVTAAAATFRPSAKLELFSLVLLQAAFSHNSFSGRRGGAFTAVLGRPKGPIAITHTHNDWACTIMYALASRLSNTTTSGIGDANDRFGSLGANGAQFDQGETAAVVGSAGHPFGMAKGKITNFRADGYIKGADAHNDVRNATVGALVAAAIEA